MIVQEPLHNTVQWVKMKVNDIALFGRSADVPPTTVPQPGEGYIVIYEH